MRRNILHKALRFFTLLIAMLLSGTVAMAYTFTSATTGNWNSSGTWTRTGTGSGNNTPGATDIVVIYNGNTVNITANAACASITPSTYSSATLTFLGAYTLMVTGSVQLSGAATQRSSTINFANGSILDAGSIIIGNSGGGVGKINMANGGTLRTGSLAVGITAGSTWTPGTGTVELDATNNLPATIFTAFNNLTINGGATTLVANTTLTGNLSVSSGTLDLSTFTANRTAAGGTLTIAGTLLVGGTSNFPTNFNTFTTTGGTVNYDNAGAQTVAVKAYNNLILSSSGAKSIVTGTSVTGKLSIAPTGSATASVGAGLNMSVGSLTLGSLGAINGTWGGTGSGATNINATYFAATTGIITVNTSTCTTPGSPTITGASICIGNTATLSAAGALSGQKYKWYSAASGGTLLKTSTNNADNTFTTSVLAATTNYWVSIMSAGGCESSRIIVTATFPLVCTDTQTPGTGSWIGYVYDGTNFSTYYGHYLEAETFNESFVGNTVCFDITSNSTAISIYTETFSVKYLMNSTKRGLYAVDLGSDDGSRLTVDGTLLYNNWGDQGFVSRLGVLMSLDGSSSLMYEFYENGGGNQVVFQNFTQILANTLATNTSQIICLGSAGSAISGDVYGTFPTGVTVSGTGYQWTSSTTPGGTRTEISGATGATFTPNTTVAPFNVAGTYYVYRNAILSSSNNISPNPYVATNESNAAVITVNALPIIAVGGAITAICQGGTSPALGGSFGGSATAAVWSAPSGTFANNTGSTPNSATFTAAANSATPITLTLTTSGGSCGTTFASKNITINPNPIVDVGGAMTAICQGGTSAALGGSFGGGATAAVWSAPSGTFANNTGSTPNSATFTAAANSATPITLTLTTSGGTCGTTSATKNIVVNPNLPVSISIASSANPICTGTSVTFTATPTNGGTTPAYQWKVNGTNVGTNSTTYTYAPVNNDLVTCVLTSNTTCTTGNPATSNTATMTVYSQIGNNTVDNTNGAHGVLCATAVENANAVLTAPAGTFFNNVVFTSYGTPNGTCPSFTPGGCNATASQSVTDTYLLGNTTGTIPATNGVFGDPCVGTVKRLYILASYTEPICAGTTPGIITGALPTGGNGIYTYLWESSTTGVASGFAPATGTNNSQNYTPGILSQTTWYRRTVTSGGCSDVSSVLHVKVSPLIAGNSIGAVQTICYNTTPAGLTGSIPTGGSGTYVYLWESSTTNATTGFVSAIGSNNGQNYTPGTLTQTTWFRRTVTSGGCINSATAIQVTVNPINTITLSSTAGTDDQTVCINTAITNISYATTGATGTTVAGLPAGVSGSWSTGVFTISGSPSTTTGNPFNYTVTTSGGCGVITTSGTITVNAQPTATAGGSQTICQTATATVSGASSSNGTITWTENGAGSITSGGTTLTPTYTPAAGDAGNSVTLTMTVSNPPCTAATATYTVIVNPNLPASVSISASATTICAGTSVTYTATPTNGGSTPVYQWKVNGTNVGTNSATYIYAPVNNDIVTCVLTSNATCATGSPATSGAINMTVNPLLPASVSIAAVPTGAICAGTSVTFTATPTNGGATPSYIWKKGGIAISPAQTGVSYTSTTLAQGDVITVEMTSNATCATGSPATSNPVGLNVNPTPTATFSGSTVVCQNAPSPLITFNNPQNIPIVITIFIASIGDYNINVGANSSSTLPVPTNIAGTYTGNNIRVAYQTAPFCINTIPGSITVTINATPTASAGGPDNVCQSAAPGAITLSGASVGGSATTGAWSITSGGGSLSSTVQTATPATVTYTPAANFTGTATLLLTSNAGTGCTAATSGRTINVNALSLAPTSISGTTTVCNGSTTTLTAVGGTLGTGANYQWGTGSVIGTNPIFGATSVSYTTPALGSSTTYWVYITNTTAPCSVTTGGVTQLVTVNQPSAAPTSISGTTTVCNGSTTTLTAVGGTLGTGANYQWGTGSIAGTNPISGATSISYLTPALSTNTTYWVYITNSTAPCTVTTGGVTQLVTINATPTASAGGPDNVCQSATPGAITLSGASIGGSATTGAWSITSGGGSLSSTTLTASPATVTYTPAANFSGTATLLLTSNAGTGCTAATSSRTINVNALSVAPTSISGTTTVCNGSTTLTAVGGTLGTGANYQWGTGSVVGTNPISGATSVSYTTPALGSSTTYWVYITNTTAPCSVTTGGVSQLVTVNQPSTAPTSISGITTICNGSATTLTVVGGSLGTGANYQWGTGSVVGTNPISGATSVSYTTPALGTNTTYWVYITNSTAPCTITTGGVSQLVTVNATPTAILSGTATICAGSSTNLSVILTGAQPWSITYTDGTNPVTITGITNSPLTIEVTPATTKTYTLTEVSDANCTGNSFTGSAVITVNEGIWLGTTSTDWHTASNWCGGIPTATTNVVIPSGTPFQPTIGSAALCNNITINTGASLTINGTNLLTVSGNWTKYGTFTPNSGTVIFNSSGASTIGASNFNNITISGNGTKNAIGSITLSGDFNLTSGQFNLNNSTNNTVTISGNYNQTGGIYDFNTGTSGASNMFIGGNLSQTTGAGSMTTSGAGAPNGIISFNGPGIQTINIPVPGASIWVKFIIPTGKSVQLLSNITLNSANLASQAVFQGEINVSGTLNLGTYTVSQNNGVAGTAVFKINPGAYLITANAGGVSGSVSSTNMTNIFSSGANYEFQGAATGTFMTSPTANTVNNLIINQSAGVTLNQNLAVTGTLHLTSGNLNTTPTNLISVNNTLTTAIIGASSTKFINGPLKWSVTTGIYLFPVGKGDVSYLPYTLTIPTGVAPIITVEAFDTDAGAGSTFDGTLTSVSHTEYWKMDLNSGSFTGKVSLSRGAALTIEDVIGQSAAQGGIYTSIAGNPSSHSINNSDDISSSGYFVMATAAKKCPVSTAISPTADQVVCQSFTVSPLTANITVGAGTGNPTMKYQWYFNPTNSNTVTGATPVSGATNQTFTPLSGVTEAGTTRYYFCVGYATDNGCIQSNADQYLASNTVKVTISPTPSAIISYSGSPFCSNLGVVSVSLTGTAGGTYTAPAGLAIDPTTGDITTSISTPGTYSVVYTIPAGGGCVSVTTDCSVTIKLDGNWNGSTNTDWNTKSNWDCNELPTLSTDVVITTGLPPTLSTGVGGMSRDLSIHSSLTVTGNTLQIAGTITNIGTFTATSGTIEMKGTTAQTIPANTFSTNTIMNLNVDNAAGVALLGPLNITKIVNVIHGDLSSAGNLVLLSTAAQTALIDGTGTGEVLGNVTMQRYLPSAFGYKYFSSPFQHAKVNEFADDIILPGTFPTFYKYDENHMVGGKDVSGWTVYTAPDGELKPLEGYTVNFGSAIRTHTVNMTGEVNNHGVSIDLKNNNKKYTNGFNLVGNPYPSPIDWEEVVLTTSNVGGGIYFYSASPYSAIIAENDTLQYVGTYSSYVQGVTTGSDDNNIAAMQGFFVHVNDPAGATPTSATLTITNSARTNNLNPTFKKAIIDNRTILRFAASFETKNAIADAAVIYFDDQANRSFDNDKDALKMMNTDLLVPNIYTLSTDSKQLSINGMQQPSDNNSTIPLGITTYNDGWINFNAKDISQLPPSMHIYLVDAEQGVTRDLKLQPEYRFYLKKGEYNTRFTLVFSLTDIVKPPVITEKMFAISRLGNQLIVKVNLPLNVSGNLMVTNVLGQVILQKAVSEIETVEINPYGGSSVYIVTLISGKRKESEKILIRKDYE